MGFDSNVVTSHRNQSQFDASSTYGDSDNKRSRTQQYMYEKKEEAHRLKQEREQKHRILVL